MLQVKCAHVEISRSSNYIFKRRKQSIRMGNARFSDSGGSPYRDPPGQRTPQDRDPLDRDPLDRDPLDRDPPGHRPLERDAWTETPRTKTPTQRFIGQRPPRETPG